MAFFGFLCFGSQESAASEKELPDAFWSKVWSLSWEKWEKCALDGLVFVPKRGEKRVIDFLFLGSVLSNWFERIWGLFNTDGLG